MSILIDIPRHKHFEDVTERGSFHVWMRHALIFAVIAALATLLIVYLMGSRRDEKGKIPDKDKSAEKLPVVADLPIKAKTTTGASSQRATSTPKKAPTPARKPNTTH